MIATTLIFGLGSPHGDDQFGWKVVERLAEVLGDNPAVTLRRASSPAALLDCLEAIDRLIICDACRSAGTPGRVYTWRWPVAPLKLLRSSGSHDVDLAEMLALAERLGHLPAEVIIWAAEIADSMPLAPLSPLGKCAVHQVVRRIAASYSAKRQQASKPA